MWFAVVFIASVIVSYFLTARMKTNSSLKAGTIQATQADEGGSIPVIFGTCDVSPNVVAFKAGTPQAIKKK